MANKFYREPIHEEFHDVTKKREVEKLTYTEFENIKGFQKYWEEQPLFESLRKCKNFEETRDTFTLWTYNYLKKFYPNVKYTILELRDSIKLENKVPLGDGYKPEFDKDTVAFKFKSDRPELYLLVQPDPILLDEARFDAYDKGPFARPDWNKINN